MSQKNLIFNQTLKSIIRLTLKLNIDKSKRICNVKNGGSSTTLSWNQVRGCRNIRSRIIYEYKRNVLNS